MQKFFIFGDSHAGNLMRSAQALGLDFHGGSIMAGTYMNEPFFKVEEGVFTMTSELGAERLSLRLFKAGLSENFLDVDMPILSTVGFNTSNFENGFHAQQLGLWNSRGTQAISTACFRAVVEAARRGALQFYHALAEAKKDVYAALSPQRFTPDNILVCRAFEDAMIDKLLALGVKIIDVRAETTGSDGILLPRFESSDSIHANEAYGAVVLHKFAESLAAAADVTDIA